MDGKHTKEGTSMNKKITVKRPDGKIFYCILAGDRSFEDQLNEWHYGSASPRGGICIYVSERTIDVTDYYAGSSLVCFEILSIEDTQLDVAPQWANA